MYYIIIGSLILAAIGLVFWGVTVGVLYAVQFIVDHIFIIVGIPLGIYLLLIIIGLLPDRKKKK